MEDYTLIGKYKTGHYYEAGIGFKSVFKNSAALLVSTGYNYKEIKKERKSYGCPLVGPCYEPLDRYLYAMTRFVFRVGYQF